MKPVAMQHCHIAQWHNRLKLSRTTSIQEDSTWKSGDKHSSTLSFLVGCWLPMDCALVSSRSRSMLQNSDPYSARQSVLLQTCRALDTPWIWEVQQWHCYAVAEALLDRNQRKGDDFLGWIVTMYKTWACSYEPNLKCQSNEWKHPSSPHSNIVHPTQYAVKVMFIVAYDIDGVILHHAVPVRQTVNTAYCCIFLQHHLCQELRRMWHLVVQNTIILHDNARSHAAAAVMDLLCCWQCEILENPLYSSDMSPCDYNLFANVKKSL